MKSYLKINYLNKDMVKIHAHICGDGNMYVKMEKTSPRNLRLGRKQRFARHILEYTNTDSFLLDNFQSYINNVAPKTYVYRDSNRIQVRNKLLYELMKKFGAGGTFAWSVPDKIFLNSLFRRYWLAAFFDDEGCISFSYICYYSSNKKGIIQIKQMLELEGIQSTLTVRHFSNSLAPGYVLRIRSSSKKHFYRKIKFSHPKKHLAYKRIFC